MLSVAAGPLHGRPVVLHNAQEPHEAASTMKVAVLAALHRSGLDLDAEVPVVNRFESAVGGSFANDPGYDSDPEPWQRIGQGRAPLRWLAERMITHSSNLATNLCLAQVGGAAVAGAWRAAGATHSASPRGIEDARARAAGVRNEVTALDLLRLVRSLEPEPLGLLERNTWRVDLAAGLPPGTRIAFKNGWFTGVRHSVGLVRPPDTAPYLLAVCYTGPLASGDAEGDPAAALLARLSARAWARRHELAGGRP
ncbi:class A beta-lactamase-related serine hydrolase [Kitasatospora sp. NBC_01250]|uniref:serine hydrolase n=1 Tax=unclassified Kitasatospora TaxID=2633591 RepID=UPI002E12F33D|nr:MULTISPECIES: serine hydrolase [unclassified Kitasatospora]WSJ68184.1 class A beta-lactamase-related serine hydrolase [Kitasatospora sp. NBC_01302]